MEQVNIDALRRVLKEHPNRLRHLSAAQRRGGAVEAIEWVVDAIERGVWPIRHWERYYLATAVSYIRLGLYDAAFDLAERAVLPDELRTTAPCHLVPEMPAFPPEAVRRDLKQALKESPLIEICRVRPLAAPTLGERVLVKLRSVWSRAKP